MKSPKQRKSRKIKHLRHSRSRGAPEATRSATCVATARLYEVAMWTVMRIAAPLPVRVYLNARTTCTNGSLLGLLQGYQVVATTKGSSRTGPEFWRYTRYLPAFSRAHGRVGHGECGRCWFAPFRGNSATRACCVSRTRFVVARNGARCTRLVYLRRAHAN